MSAQATSPRQLSREVPHRLSRTVVIRSFLPFIASRSKEKHSSPSSIPCEDRRKKARFFISFLPPSLFLRGSDLTHSREAEKNHLFTVPSSVMDRTSPLRSPQGFSSHLMDKSNGRSSSSTTVATTTTSTSGQIYKFLLGNHLSPYSSVISLDAAEHKPTPVHHLAGTAHFGPSDNSTSNGDASLLLPGFEPGAVVCGNRGMPSQEPELDGYDCESEEGVELADEPPKQTTSRGSGSKRSRAAEVHNLSEKRRRSRINEKMKALQKLIPNSNKTDKASMLDEAIDYLKQLQLQVQMLSMRNGLSLTPPYLPPALQSVQTPPMRYGSDSASSLVNLGMGMISLDSPSSSSYSLPNQVTTTTHQTRLPGTSNISDPIACFAINSSQSQHGFFHLPAVTTEGVYANEAIPHQINSTEAIRSASLNFQGQSHVANTNAEQERISNHLNSEALFANQTNTAHIHMQQKR